MNQTILKENYNIKKRQSNDHDIEFVLNIMNKSCNYGWHGAEYSFIKYLEKINNFDCWEDSTVGTSEGNVINSEIRSSKKLPFKTSITRSYHKDIFKINDIIKDNIFNKNPSFLEDTLYYDNNFDLLKYEEGDFFAKHTDGNSELNHFGTLLILPPKAYSNYEGGELILYDGEEEIEIISDQNYWKIIGFNTEIPHELKPVTSGTRYAYKSKIIIPDDTTNIVSIYNKNNIEYTGEEKKEESDSDNEYYYSDDDDDINEEIKEPTEGNYILDNADYTNDSCITQIHYTIKDLKKNIRKLEKKIENYQEKIRLFEDPNYHQFKKEIVGYMQKTKKGKFIVICEHFCSYPEPKKLYGNDRKLFDILIQNYDTDIMLLKATVKYEDDGDFSYITINDKIEKLMGGYEWSKYIKEFNINSNLNEKDSIGGVYCGEKEEYNDENYYTQYTNKVVFMLVTFRV